jgi:hypothetical protein
MWETSSVSLQHLYLQNTQKRKSQQALCFTAQNESIHEVVQNTYSMGGHKMKMGKESVMMCLSCMVPLRVKWSCSYPVSLLTLMVKSRLSTLPQYQSSQMDMIFCRFIPLSVLQTVSLCSVLMLLFCPSLPKRVFHQNCPYMFLHLKYVSSVL